jgi:hypothetical protein
VNDRLRRALRVLAIVLLLLAPSGGAVAFTIYYVHATNQEFCDVTSAAAIPVAQPADPAAAPATARQHTWYVRFATLNKRLGC